MPTPLTDADKVLRNDTGKDIVEKLDDIAQALGVGVNADQINYNNTTSGLESENVQDAVDEVKDITDNLDNKLDGLTDIISTASGAIATFNDGGNNIPVKSLVTDIAATQEGSGTPAPDNIRAITGVDEVKDVVTGKDLMPSLFGSNTNNGITYTVNDDNTITVTGQVASGNSNRNYGHIILPAGTYTLSGFPDTLVSTTVREAALVLCKNIYSGSQNIIVSLYSNIARTATFTLTEATDCYLRIYLYAQAGAMPANTVFKVQIEKGEEATEYEKYKGTTHTITLPETIYGGTADVVNGNGTKTWGYVEFDGTESIISRLKAHTFLIRDSKLNDTPAISVDGVNALCNRFVRQYPVQYASIADGQYLFNASTISPTQKGFVCRVDSINDTTEDFTTWLTSNHIQVAFPFDTPTAFTFTGANIPTLSGENNIYSNCGDVAVEYFNSKADWLADLIKAMSAT